MSRNDDANERAAAVSRDVTTDPADPYPPEPKAGERFTPASAVGPVAERLPSETWVAAEGAGEPSPPADESERAQLIAGITRLLRQTDLPENARLAALTLIGWLARRRPQEVAHAVGVEEARRSERSLRAARSKAR